MDVGDLGEIGIQVGGCTEVAYFRVFQLSKNTHKFDNRASVL